jgi:uncharacterized protein DUF6580
MLAYIFVVLAFLFRFVPHPWGFTPVAGSLLFFGARGTRRQYWFPIALLALSDVLLDKFVYAYPFSWEHLVTWAWYGAIVALGTKLRDTSKPVWILASALGSSVSFFLLSNFAVWIWGTMYPKTMAGLMTCYTLGLPFFQRDLEGNLAFTAVMFAIPAILGQFSERFSRNSAAA